MAFGLGIEAVPGHRFFGFSAKDYEHGDRQTLGSQLQTNICELTGTECAGLQPLLPPHFRKLNCVS
jgi:hypothetical protein